jgi:GAF domain-containing protein
MAFPEQSLRDLVSLSEVVLLHDNLIDAQNEICRIAVRAIPVAEGASLTAFSELGPGAVAASDEWAYTLDETQFVEHEGPCLDAARSGLVFRVRDTGAEPRWPNYMPRAFEMGARSMVSLPMTAESKLIGALNVYSREPDAFTPEQVSIAELIAAHASLASHISSTLLKHKSLAEQLREAMASRATIEQAKGVLMATTRCSADEAFQLLREQSSAENRKLRDIAEEIVARQSS